MSGSSARGDDLEAALEDLGGLTADGARAGILDALFDETDTAGALRRLRGAMRTHEPGGAGRASDLSRLVRKLDNRTRTEGFRVLHSWNHRLHAFTEDITPVLMLDYYVRARGADGSGGDAEAERSGRVALAILLDYYLLHLLALCAMRAWDAEDPDDTLDRTTALIESLQGPAGSGHRFVDDAETAIIYALSQFHPEEHAYDRFIERFRPLRPERQLRFASASASVLSCHLRWGFWLMYGRDVVRMRADNVGDYPWLLYSVATLLKGWVAARDGGGPPTAREGLVGALLQGLAADPWAFTGRPPPALEAFAAEHEEVRTLLGEHGAALIEELEAHRPSKASYAPLALHFNFPHNALVALVAMALFEGSASETSFNRLFRRDEPEGEEASPTENVARALTAYSGASPDRLGARGARLVAYDPLSGMRSFAMTTDALRELIG